MDRYDPAFYNQRAGGSRVSAQFILPLVLGWVRPASIIDVGCGSGEWIRALDELGYRGAVGMDGPHVAAALSDIPGATFIPQDLSTDITLNRRFELAISVEVAEHLPPHRASTFISDLCQISDVILFSAAIPGQDGVGHINEQWPDYWISLFEQNGFAPYDCLRARLWEVDSIEWWYAQNLFLFAKPGHRELSPLIQPLPTRLPHPRNYLHKLDRWRPENSSLRDHLLRTPKVLLGFLGRTLMRWGT